MILHLGKILKIHIKQIQTRKESIAKSAHIKIKTFCLSTHHKESKNK